MSMSKFEGKKKMVWSIPKGVHFWVAPPSMGHYRGALNAPFPPPLHSPSPFQSIRCESLKIDTLTLDTLRLV